MVDTSEKRPERLYELWEAWGLTPDQSTAEAQRRALGTVEAWLGGAASDPEIAVQAVQLLLLDPEHPGAHRRTCWASLKKALREGWVNVGTAPDHVVFAQALILAAWPRETQSGWLRLAPLLDAAWDLCRGRAGQQDDLNRWRERARLFQVDNQSAISITPVPNIDAQSAEENEEEYDELGDERDLEPLNTSYQGFVKTRSKQWTRLNATVQQSQYFSGGGELIEMLTALDDGLQRLSSGLEQVAGSCNNRVIRDLQEVEHRLQLSRSELNLLWWGQARYSRSLRKPFRRIEPKEDVLWWAAWEAASVAVDLEVEPAAAYLVETLASLSHDLSQQRSVLGWMDALHQTLQRERARVPVPCERLRRLLEHDALGLPVSWVRLRAERNEPLAEASERIGLDLQTPIDLGQWAAWIFREALLDLHLTRVT